MTGDLVYRQLKLPPDWAPPVLQLSLQNSSISMGKHNRENQRVFGGIFNIFLSPTPYESELFGYSGQG